MTKYRSTAIEVSVRVLMKMLVPCNRRLFEGEREEGGTWNSGRP